MLGLLSLRLQFLFWPACASFPSQYLTYSGFHTRRTVLTY